MAVDRNWCRRALQNEVGYLREPIEWLKSLMFTFNQFFSRIKSTFIGIRSPALDLDHEFADRLPIELDRVGSIDCDLCSCSCRFLSGRQEVPAFDSERFRAISSPKRRTNSHDAIVKNVNHGAF